MGGACDKCSKATEGSSTEGVDGGGEDDGEGGGGDAVAVAGTALQLLSELLLLVLVSKRGAGRERVKSEMVDPGRSGPMECTRR